MCSIWPQRTGGHGTSSFAQGITSSELGLTTVPILPVDLTSAGKCLHAFRRISAVWSAQPGMKEKQKFCILGLMTHYVRLCKETQKMTFILKKA